MASGIDMLLKIQNEVQKIVLAGGDGSDTYKLTFDGSTTSAITETATAAALEAELISSTDLTDSDVDVSGSAGGPYYVEFKGDYVAKKNDLMTSSDEIDSLTVMITKITTGTGADTPYAVAGQRNTTFNRSCEIADATNKDTENWFRGEPSIRRWEIPFDNVITEDDAAKLALENAYNDNYQIHVALVMPSGTTKYGVCTLTELNFDGPHDGVFVASGTLVGSQSYS